MADETIELRLPFLASPLDRFGEHRRDENFLAGLLADPAAQLLLVVDGTKVPLAPDGTISWRPLQKAEPGEPLVFLGIDEGGRPLFSRVALESEREEPGEQFTQLREVGHSLSEHDAAAAVQAVALAAWHRLAPNCVSCGGTTVVEDAGHLRRCSACGAGHFPRTDPAVIMLVTDGERCVLGRRSGSVEGRWSTLAGYVEAGESLESAVIREVHEEVGLVVHGLRYRGSQPWPFPSSLMVAFEADAEYGPLTINDEHHEVRWFTRDEVADGITSGAMTAPGPISAGRFLIRSWLGGAPI